MSDPVRNYFNQRFLYKETCQQNNKIVR